MRKRISLDVDGLREREVLLALRPFVDVVNGPFIQVSDIPDEGEKVTIIRDDLRALAAIKVAQDAALNQLTAEYLAELRRRAVPVEPSTPAPPEKVTVADENPTSVFVGKPRAMTGALKLLTRHYGEDHPAVQVLLEGQAAVDAFVVGRSVQDNPDEPPCDPAPIVLNDHIEKFTFDEKTPTPIYDGDVIRRAQYKYGERIDIKDGKVVWISDTHFVVCHDGEIRVFYVGHKKP